MEITHINEIASQLKFKFPYSMEKWANLGYPVENYHKHTTWSNFFQIDSCTTIPQFSDMVQKRNGTLLFSGEHGFQGEWVKVYDYCKNIPLNFRYSVEAYWVKDASEGVSDRSNCHIVIVARNYEGIRKMNYILSIAHDKQFYYKPRIDLKQLFTLTKDDVYVTSACLAGWKYEDAPEIWKKVADHFGDSFFLEYQAHDTDEQKRINQMILDMHRKYGIQTIIGLDTHWISDEDKVKRSKLLERKQISYPEETGWYMDYPTGEELIQRMQKQGIVPLDDVLCSMMNTHVFVNGCEDFDYDMGFKIPIIPKYQGMTYEERSDVLWSMLMDQYHKEEHQTDDRLAGIKYEFNEIKESGTVDYFIGNGQLVQDAVHKFGGQLTTTSRGSASSYYCSKLLEFTTMDRFESEVPIFPERFITKERVIDSHQCPDVDWNVASQEPFVRAARGIFGEQSCYPLLAVGTLKEKNAFKMYAGVNNIEPSVANEITRRIDAFNEAVKNADDDDKDSIKIEDYITDPKLLKVYNESKAYQGIIDQAKVHACGFALFNGNPRQKDVVGYGDIRYEIGLIRSYSEATGKSVIIADIEGNMLDALGYVKDDFLVVDVVSLIYKLYHNIGMEVPTVTQLRKMVDNDKPTWDLYANGVTCCLNQCEKSATTNKVMTYKPQNVAELASFIAGIRPGFKSLIDGFCRREPYSTGEEQVDDLLSDSAHFMLFQESIMKVLGFLGLPMNETYGVIKSISKKKLKGEKKEHLLNTLHESWQNRFGNLNNFDAVWKVISDAARYSFNAPHALAMAFDSLYEAWMKAHYPDVFYATAIDHYLDKNDKNKAAELQKEAVTKMGYSVGKYTFGADNMKITIKDKVIYPRLSGIKGMGSAVGEILAEIYKRNPQSIIDIYQWKKGTKLGDKTVESLIAIGYFHQFGTVKQLTKCSEIAEDWLGKKTLPKSKLAELGITDGEIKKWQCATDLTKTGKHSDKRYTITDSKAFVKLLCSKVPPDEYGATTLAQKQYEVLGYTDVTDPTLDKRFIMVTNLDTKYSPKFEAVCLNNGKSALLKVHSKKPYNDKRCKASFDKVPFKDGDIIYMSDCMKKQRESKVNGRWMPIPGAFDWWIEDYFVLDNVNNK